MTKTGLVPLVMKAGSVSPIYIFGREVKGSETGKVLAAFDSHGAAFRASCIADGAGRHPDWAEAMSPGEWAKVKDINEFLAVQPQYTQ